MTITPLVRIVDRSLIVKDRTILTNVPDNVIATSGSISGPVNGVFLGAVLNESNSRHVVSLGTLRDVRFVACFRYMLWWMTQKMGDRGREIPFETQFMLVEAKGGSHTGSDGGSESDQTLYTVFLPLIEGPFRACLQGNTQDELELCLESGDPKTTSSSFSHCLFINTGTDPFEAIRDAITAVKFHLKTFRQRHEKRLPEIVDYFGWCTWDAFYSEVTPEGVEAGLASLVAGGTPPKFVIIDDGWQSTGSDAPQQQEMDRQGPIFRLTGIKENAKFQKKEDPTVAVGIKHIVDIAKEKYGLKYVYMWHAIIGYWGGVSPTVKEMEQYEPLIKHPIIPKGVVENEPVWKSDAVELQGVGVVDPRNVDRFYVDYHGYLASAGIDGVKVDGQCILETLGDGFGGRVELTRQYHQALDASIAKNFADNRSIACMSHNTDSLYCSKQTAVVRASNDFFPNKPEMHTIHIAAVAYNSLFLGEFMLPDWDMFYSLHPAAEFHASARAISGGPVYISDVPGKHNFDLLKKLVLPDGSILRARLHARPTKDCLFSDPTRDDVCLLKIWNMNKHTGVLGVYNCQGSAWNSNLKKNTFHQTRSSDPITRFINGHDVHLIADVAVDPTTWNGDCALYSHRSNSLITLPNNTTLPVSLKTLDYEIFTVTPIKDLATGLSFAPFGLIDMFNSGGAIEELRYELVSDDGSEVVAMVFMQVRGCGRFGAYSSAKPKTCKVGSNVIEFGFDLETCLVTLDLDCMPGEGQQCHILVFEL